MDCLFRGPPIIGTPKQLQSPRNLNVPFAGCAPIQICGAPCVSMHPSQTCKPRPPIGNPIAGHCHAAHPPPPFRARGRQPKCKPGGHLSRRHSRTQIQLQPHRSQAAHAHSSVTSAPVKPGPIPVMPGQESEPHRLQNPKLRLVGRCPADRPNLLSVRTDASVPSRNSELPSIKFDPESARRRIQPSSDRRSPAVCRCEFPSLLLVVLSRAQVEFSRAQTGGLLLFAGDLCPF